MSENNAYRAGVVHVNDDIEEEDNHLPNWWLATLFGTIVFGFVYWFVFETTGVAPNPGEVYAVESLAIMKARAAQSPLSDESLAVLAQDQALVNAGKTTYAQMCAPCHAPNGQGQVGPNLTDKFWLHGARPMEIHKSIDEGFATKGMPAWGAMLGAGRVRELTVFVLSLKGKNLPGKEPQGIPIE